MNYVSYMTHMTHTIHPQTLPLTAVVFRVPGGWPWHKSRIFKASRPASFTQSAERPKFQTRAPGCARRWCCAESQNRKSQKHKIAGIAAEGAEDRASEVRVTETPETESQRNDSKG